MEFDLRCFLLGLVGGVASSSLVLSLLLSSSSSNANKSSWGKLSLPGVGDPRKTLERCGALLDLDLDLVLALLPSCDLLEDFRLLLLLDDLFDGLTPPILRPRLPVGLAPRPGGTLYC